MKNKYDQFLNQVIPPVSTTNIFRRFLRYFIPCAMVLIALFALYIKKESDDLTTSLIEREKENVKHIQMVLVRDLEILASDLLILANSDQIIRMENGENPKHLRSLEQRFLTFLRDRQIYDQIRFINADGKEVVRADLHDNIPGITPADQLQDKSTRYYFKETIGLKPGELYVSPLDLNVENGQVTLPFKPMLRIATLVTNSAGEISGIVILNFLADIILQHFSDFLSQGNEGKYSLVNRDGYWIIGPKKGQEWGFMFGLNYTFQSAYRKEWEQISKLDRGQIQGSDGNFFIFSSIPVKKSLLRAFSGRGNPQGGPIIRETTERERKWIIISHLSTQGGIEVLFKREGRFILISLIAVMCLTGVTLWITAVNRTVRKHSEMALLLLSSGLEHSPAGVILTDNKGTIEFINRRFSEISGYGVEEILGSNPRALKSGETTDQEYADMWKSITSGDTWIGEFHNRRKDDSYYWASASISPIFDAKGEITHFIGVQEDVTEKKAMQEKLQRMATIDALTGALNRRQFFEKLEIELERGRRFDHAMSLLMIDVDHFKKINDKYGHQKGDEVLVEITKIFNKTLRQSDLLGRFGGEEFIIALPETTISESFVLAERLRHRIELADFGLSQRAAAVTVSIGLAEFLNDSEIVDELIARADRALYKAKRTGRNLVVAAPESKTEIIKK